ncbi:MAG: tyrosine-type recombinase/integrase [Vibrio sp.]
MNQLSTLTQNINSVRPQQLVQYLNSNPNDSIDYENVQKLILHFQQQFYSRQGQHSESTLRRLKSAWGLFVTWCNENNCRALPSTPEIVENYLKSTQDALRGNTLKVNLWAISKTHKISGCPDPTKDIYVEGQIKQIIRNKKYNGETPQQATAFNEYHLNLIIDLWSESINPINKRDLMVLGLAYESLLRESELVRIKLKHINWNQDGSALITVPYTKTNQVGSDEVVYISRQVTGFIKKYLENPELDKTEESYLIQGFTKKGNVRIQVEPKPISTKTIERIFSKVACVLGLDQIGVRQFTGHSARVGAAQDLLRDGFTTLQVQQSGRWSTERMVLHYGKGILAEDSAMARKRR